MITILSELDAPETRCEWTLALLHAATVSCGLVCGLAIWERDCKHIPRSHKLDNDFQMLLQAVDSFLKHRQRRYYRREVRRFSTIRSRTSATPLLLATYC
jgi:hypothetical protein